MFILNLSGDCSRRNCHIGLKGSLSFSCQYLLKNLWYGMMVWCDIPWGFSFCFAKGVHVSIETKPRSFAVSCTSFTIKTFRAHSWALKSNVRRNMEIFSWTWVDLVLGAKWECYVKSFAITCPRTDFCSVVSKFYHVMNK